jgi:putative membrane protein insertion efficiency factor
MNKLFIYFIKGYQLLLSPFFKSHCRFTPTCSTYTIDALNNHGGVKGIFLVLKRFSKCRPGHPGGFDPVPK